MRYLLLAFLFAFPVLVSQAQQQFTFNSSGKAIREKDTGFTRAQAAVSTLTLTPQQKNTIKKELAARVQQSINNIQDDSLRWKHLYQDLWGTATYNTILDEMRRFRQYLLSSNNARPNGTYNYVPDPTDIERDLFNASIYEPKLDSSGLNYKAWQLIFTNPLKHYLLIRLKETMDMDGLGDQNIDIDYVNGWRRLEDTLINIDKALAEIKSQLSPCSPTECKDYQPLINRVNNLLGNASTDTVVNLLRKSFFKKWLWYNQGFLLINPLSFTTADRRYPVTEKISQLSEDDKKSLLSDAIEDSLLNKMLTTRKIRNEALTLISGGKIKKENDFYYYDAALNYKCLNENSLPKFKDTKKGIGIMAYNVPAKESLKIKLDKSVLIPDKGAVVQSIEDGLSSTSLTSILTNASGIISAFQKIGPALNGVRPAINTPVIQGYDNRSYSATNLKSKVILITNGGNEIETEIGKSSIGAKSFMLSSMMISPLGNKYNFGDSTILPKSRPQYSEFMYNSSLLKDDREASEEEYFVIINKRKIAATKVSEADKINFINASFIKDDSRECFSCNNLTEKCLIDTFIKIDRCYELNYEDSTKLRKGTDSLLERFRCYIQTIYICRTNLKNYEVTLLQLKDRVKSILSIIQRSLPPVLNYDIQNRFFQEEQTDTAHDFRTVVFTPALPEAPKKIVYEVYSNLPGKLLDGKDPADTNFVIRHKFKYAKRHYVDFSVGLAYTTTDYLLKSNSGTALPQITEADRFKPIAGMHVYPLGMVKVDDRLFPRNFYTRFSFFAGVSLSKPLENLYPAISYDFVPGIRFMCGLHFFKDTRYTISNNTVVDQASAFRKSGTFISLNLEPTTFIKLIGLIK